MTGKNKYCEGKIFLFRKVFLEKKIPSEVRDNGTGSLDTVGRTERLTKGIEQRIMNISACGLKEHENSLALSRLLLILMHLKGL